MSASKERCALPDPRMDMVSWQVVHNAMGSVHVVAHNDTYEHTLSGECRCGVHAETGDDGTTIWVHDSFDGREAFENGERKTS